MRIRKPFRVAAALRAFLKATLPTCSPWVSDIDMPPGTEWFHEIREQLQKADAVILCFTPDNLKSHWMHFEVGTIAATAAREKKPVCPYLVGGLSPKDLASPLNAWHGIRSDEGGTKRLVDRLNSLLEPVKRVRGDELWKKFKEHWPNLRSELDKVNIAYPLEFRVEAKAHDKVTFQRKVYFFMRNVSEFPVLLTEAAFNPHPKCPRLAQRFLDDMKAGMRPKFYDTAKKLHELPAVIVRPGETTHIYVAYENSLPIADIQRAVKNKEIGTVKLELWTNGRTITYRY